MTGAQQTTGYRLLVVDDNPDIHEDIRKALLANTGPSAIDEIEAELFGEEGNRAHSKRSFDIA